ncbi:hypothetical protein D7Y41_02700 [Anaerotruncus sp. 1XD22-93]|nr:hypothetical protein [Lachnospiraceae bacterium]NBI74228.1 hypothetical protein [Lachnospiraceae bacterium]RKK00383.1 hypothetical protein D7Y41_02700 [Anaerotruncus sp. 1XD22-93]
MRAVIGREVDINQPLNLRRLSPWQKVIVAIRKELSESSFFLNSKRERMQEAHKARIVREDKVKEMILTEIYQELVKGASGKGSDRVQKIVIAVNPEFKDVIFDSCNSEGEVVRQGIFSHSDFSQYEIVAVKENADIRRAFSKMPYLFEVSRKLI